MPIADRIALAMAAVFIAATLGPVLMRAVAARLDVKMDYLAAVVTVLIAAAVTTGATLMIRYLIDVGARYRRVDREHVELAVLVTSCIAGVAILASLVSKRHGASFGDAVGIVIGAAVLMFAMAAVAGFVARMLSALTC